MLPHILDSLFYSISTKLSLQIPWHFLDAHVPVRQHGFNSQFTRNRTRGICFVKQSRRVINGYADRLLLYRVSEDDREPFGIVRLAY